MRFLIFVILSCIILIWFIFSIHVLLCLYLSLLTVSFIVVIAFSLKLYQPISWTAHKKEIAQFSNTCIFRGAKQLQSNIVTVKKYMSPNCNRESYSLIFFFVLCRVSKVLLDRLAKLAQMEQMWVVVSWLIVFMLATDNFPGTDDNSSLSWFSLFSSHVCLRGEFSKAPLKILSYGQNSKFSQTSVFRPLF